MTGNALPPKPGDFALSTALPGSALPALLTVGA